MLRWIIGIFGLVLLLLAVAIISLFLLPADRIAKVAADQIRVLTGRDVTISGDVSMSFFPVLGVSAGSLEVGNAEWSKQGPMLTARDAAIGLDAMALLRGDILITNVEAASPTIRLESRKDGRASWQFTDASGAASIETGTEAGDDPQSLWIEKLRVTDATLIYDAEGADLVEYSGVDLALDWSDRSGGAEIDAVLRPTGEAVRLQASIGGFASFLGGTVQPVSVVMKGGGGEVQLTGRADLSGAVAGDIALNLPDTGAFLAALALPAVDLPRGLGRAIDASAELTLTADRHLALRDLNADLGGNRIAGAADIFLNGVPQVNAKLSAGALDLSALGGGSGGGAAQAGLGGWPRTAIDASGLAAFNGDIALSAEALNFGTIKLGPTRALLRNDRSRMVFELREAAAYDGTLSGEFVVNNRSGLSVGGKLFGQGIGVQGLLNDLAGITRLTGSADAELKFLGSGQSVHAIMNSLSGNGAVNLGRGTIEGIDLDQLMRSGKGSGGTTIFDSLGATFTLEGGNLYNDDLLLLLPNFEARGNGRVGLGAQDLDYLFTPKSLRGNNGKGIAIPVRIKGPWTAPRILPDLEAALDLNFAEEKKALENKVKDEIENRVQKELGVQAEDGQSVEDAIEDKLKDELEDGLRSLFD